MLVSTNLLCVQTIRQVEIVDGATIVSFRHNEKPLGAAFTIEGWTGAKLRPVVSLGKEGQVGKPASFVEDGEDGEDDAGSCCQRRGSCGGS